MRLGSFGIAKDVEAVAKAGFDFIELNLRELVEMDAASFAALRTRIADAGLGADACSWILPVDLDLTAAQTRFEDWRGYLETGVERTVSLGTTLWPIGSGKGRSMKPENGPEQAQKGRVAEFFARLSEIAKQGGIDVLIEPLGPAYSNHLLTLAETAAFVDSLDKDNVFTMCDLRHLMAAGDRVEEIPRFGEKILHTHIDLPVGPKRIIPRPDDGYDYGPYLQAIRHTQATRLSVESLHEDNLAECGAAVSYLREQMAKNRL